MASSSWSWRGVPARRRRARRRRRAPARPPPTPTAARSVVGVGDGAPVGQHGVDPQPGGVLEQRAEVVLRPVAAGLPRLRLEVEHDDQPGGGLLQRRRAASGTSRCGITEVNHEPGPEHHPVGLADRRRPPPGRPAGRRGSSATETISPSVVATSTWPRTVGVAAGSAGSRPRTSAVMSIGVSAIGSTRPRAPSSRPTQSSARTWSPSSSHRPTISRLPTTWPRISPSPAKRCWTTSAQVRPHSSSPHSAASAIRRSPGGSTPNSPRSRPDEPPLSATVTTAVTWSRVRSSWSRRSALSEAWRPCPPPRATADCAVGRTSLPPEVAVGGADVVALRRPAGAAISSVIATLRCLPPVQPMATVMNRLPSPR